MRKEYRNARKNQVAFNTTPPSSLTLSLSIPRYCIGLGILPDLGSDLHYSSCFSLLLVNASTSKFFDERLFLILTFCLRVFRFPCQIVSCILYGILIGKPTMYSEVVFSGNLSSRCSLVAKNIPQGDKRFSLNSIGKRKHLLRFSSWLDFQLSPNSLLQVNLNS